MTISSSFGTGGSVIAAGVGSRLGWPVHNRVIPMEVAQRLALPPAAALAKDEAHETRFGRLISRLSIELAREAGAHVPPEIFHQDDAFRRHSDDLVTSYVAAADCVIVGRAAAAVLAGRPEVLHVRFDGEPGRRAVQAANALGLSLEEAKRRLAETDRARAEYWKVFYRRDWTDATLYHLAADSTRISLDGCIELVLLAAADVLHVSARA